MSTRISTGLGGTFNKGVYYNYCNSLIEGMRSGGISETSIDNAYKQYNEDCNISNTYYLKFFPKIEKRLNIKIQFLLFLNLAEILIN